LENLPVTGAKRTFFLLAAAFSAVVAASGFGSAAAETIRISGTGGAVGTIPFLAEAFRKVRPDVRIDLLPSMGSSGAVKAVLAGRLDIGLSGRPLTGEERDRGAVETRYAATPFVFCVNKGVEADRLTLEEVVEIYAGRRDRWRNGTRLRLITRPPMDSDIPVLKGISQEMSRAVESALHRKGMIVAMTDHEAADLVADVPGAFGAVTLSLVVTENRKVRVLALGGIMPSLRTIADGSYPCVKTFRMVTRRDPGAAVRGFVEFVRSPSGAAVLAKYGQAVLR
jgi:phosphate transport system substrate-binding protein